MLNHNVVWVGTFYRCYHFAKQLVRRGHEVTILTTSPQRRFGFSESAREGVRIVEAPDLLWGMLRTGWCPWNTINRMAFLRHERYDLIHAFDSRPVVILPGLFLHHRHRVPLLMDWCDWWGRGGVIEERPNKLIKLLFGAIETYFEEAFRHRADLLTVISTALGERAHGLGIPREKIVHLPGGADVDFWVPLPQAQARAEVGIPAQALVVGYMGFVHYDIELILRSFAVVRRSVDAKLLLTGKRNPLTRQLGEELGVLDHILDMGTVPYEDVPKYVASADVCLLPFANKIANIGRWPNKLGDYLAMGRPVVSNPVGDVQALLASERCGLMARDEPEDFAAKVVTLLEDSTLREEMAANARRVAAEKISYDRLALRLEECYYRALETMREGAGSTAGLSARQQR